MDELSVTTSWEEHDRVVVTVRGPLDAFDAWRLGRPLRTLLDDCQDHEVVVDLRETTFCGSGCVRVLDAAAAVAEDRDCRLSVRGLTGQTARIFRALGREDLLRLARDEQEG